MSQVPFKSLTLTGRKFQNLQAKFSNLFSTSNSQSDKNNAEYDPFAQNFFTLKASNRSPTRAHALDNFERYVKQEDVQTPSLLFVRHISEIDMDQEKRSNIRNPVYTSDEDDEEKHKHVYLEPQLSVESSETLEDYYETINEILVCDIENRVKLLKSEMLASSITILIKSSVLQEYFLPVIYLEKLWIGDINLTKVKIDSVKNLHVGDQILRVNGKRITSYDQLKAVIQQYNDLFLELKRMPFGRVITLTHRLNIQMPKKLKERLNLARDYLGIKLDSEKGRIVKIFDGLVRQNGLKYLPNSVVYELTSLNSSEKQRLTTWNFTEINDQPLGIRCSSDLVLNLLFNSKKLMFIVQPGDLIKGFKKEIKKIKF